MEREKGQIANFNVLIYSSTITPRLQYIADFSGKEIIGHPFETTSGLAHFKEHKGFKINYSAEKIDENEFWIRPCSLLFENKIREQLIQCSEVDGNKVFFGTEGDFPFDIFAACFYLLSRYEEYIPHQTDMYGRYAHANSLAYKEGFLDKPLINYWLQLFKAKLKQKFPSLTPHHSSFTFLPTYDIDIAWAFKNKGLLRNAGGFVQSMLKGDWLQCWERLATLNGKQKDPFDTYEWMSQLNERYQLDPHYFFLVAERTGRYDKNISPMKGALQKLVKDHHARYRVGIHPSWRSGDEKALLQREIITLKEFTGSEVVSSRQHYIRFTLPQSFRRLIDHGIRFDYSMGYGSTNGFRASVALPFYWYDLEKEEQTSLLLFPFCYMEANSFYEQHYTPGQALEEMNHYYNCIKAVNGTCIMIWHNHFLSTNKLYKGWREVYEQFISETVGQE